MTALAGTQFTPLHPISYLYSPSSIYITRSKQLAFTSLKQTTKRWIGHHLSNMLRISSPTDPTAQMFMRQTNTLSRQFWILTDSSSSKEITTAKITRTYPGISISLSITITIFTNKTDQTHNYTLQSHKQTNTWKKHLDKIDHKHNPHSL